MKTVETMFPVAGMSCATCAGRIERALASLDGVVAASVSFAGEQAIVRYDPARLAPDDLEAAVIRAGYRVPLRAADAEAQELARERRTRRRELTILAGAAVLTVPLVAPMALLPFGVHWMLGGWIQLALATPVQLVAGWRFYRGAWQALRARTANMDVLVALGTTAAYALGVGLLLARRHDLTFESSAAVITLVLLGKALESRAKRSAMRALRELMDLRPRTARVLLGGAELEVPVERVRAGHVVVVRPGERVPVDGRVLEGRSHVDESLITGESLPVAREPGDELPGGAINGTGLLRLEATRVGEDSTLAQIVQLVTHAQASRPPVQRLVDRVAAVFVPAVVVVAAITLAGWLLAGASAATALMNAAAVLVIACPCALGLATPTALMVGTGAAARAGILIRDAAALEQARAVGVVVFDKTGTLTEGRPELVEIVNPGGDAGDLLAEVAAVQDGSEHVLGKAVVAEARARGLQLPAVTGFLALPGRGVEATVAGRTVAVGSRRLMEERGVELDGLAGRARAAEDRGHSVVFVARDGRAAGLLAFGDRPRAGAREAVRRLAQAGIESVMLTGDRRAPAQRVAEAVGIRRVVAEVLPDGKAQAVRALQDGRAVAMVGDGVNDAPALAAADVGFAMGTGTDVAMHTAGVTLMRPEPGLVADAIAVSRATVRTIRQNLFFAFFYNVIAIPLAVAGLLTPAIAGAAMAASSVSVVANALRLRRFSAVQVGQPSATAGAAASCWRRSHSAIGANTHSSA